MPRLRKVALPVVALALLYVGVSLFWPAAAGAASQVHKQGAGLLDQSAEWVGSTVGAAARTMRRAAGAVGLGKMDAGDAIKTVRNAAAADTVSETAQTVMKRGRRITKQAARSGEAELK